MTYEKFSKSVCMNDLSTISGINMNSAKSIIRCYSMQDRIGKKSSKPKPSTK